MEAKIDKLKTDLKNAMKRAKEQKDKEESNSPNYLYLESVYVGLLCAYSDVNNNF